MAVTGDPDRLAYYGEEFKAIPSKVSVRLTPAELATDGPISSGLAETHRVKADAAVRFAREMDDGLVTAGTGLVRIAANLADVDRRGADAIAELFPTRTPDSGESG
jgi:hypothetical protein